MQEFTGKCIAKSLQIRWICYTHCMSDLQNYLKFAEQAAYKAGQIMLKHFQIGIAKEDKEDGSPVTIADREVNHFVIEAVKKAYPGHAVLGEEESHAKEGAEYVWVCDPIDGTIPFMHGIPTNQFSLALVHNGQPIVGVIYDPYMKRLYKAMTAGGAFMNDFKLHVNDKSSLAGNFIAAPTHQMPLLDSVNLLSNLSKHGLKSYCHFCITYEAVYVALGQFVGTVFGHPSAHDIAAIKIIVEEAGGKVTDLFGNEQRYDQPIKGAIISNGKVHDELTALVKDFILHD